MRSVGMGEGGFFKVCMTVSVLCRRGGLVGERGWRKGDGDGSKGSREGGGECWFLCSVGCERMVELGWVGVG